MASVLVVVISYKNAGLTVEAYRSLRSQTEPVDVVIWDNNSPDGSRELLGSRLQVRPNDRLVLSDENLLWTPAINRAFNEWGSSYDYLVMMNNDISLPPHAIESMKEYASYSNVGSVGPLAARLGGFQDPVHMPPRNGDNFHEATYLLGACVMLRRKVWDIVGELDPEMPLGADDHDYAIRQREAGLKLIVDRGVLANNAGHASGGSPEWDIWGDKSWQRFNEKYAGYYFNEEEALNCHWGGVFRGWYRGTGWVDNERRAEIWKLEGRQGEPYVR